MGFYFSAGVLGWYELTHGTEKDKLDLWVFS